MLSRFYASFVPQFEIAGKLALSVDVAALARDCEGIIAFSSEGANLLVPKNKLTDNETLALCLLAAYLGKKLSLLNSDELSKDELQAKLGKPSKTTSTRLGELVKNNWVTKEDDNFRMTMFGVTQMQKDVLPRIISKTEI